MNDSFRCAVLGTRPENLCTRVPVGMRSGISTSTVQDSKSSERSCSVNYVLNQPHDRLNDRLIHTPGLSISLVPGRHLGMARRTLQERLDGQSPEIPLGDCRRYIKSRRSVAARTGVRLLKFGGEFRRIQSNGSPGLHSKRLVMFKDLSAFGFQARSKTPRIWNPYQRSAFAYVGLFLESDSDRGLPPEPGVWVLSQDY